MEVGPMIPCEALGVDQQSGGRRGNANPPGESGPLDRLPPQLHGNTEPAAVQLEQLAIAYIILAPIGNSLSLVRALVRALVMAWPDRAATWAARLEADLQSLGHRPRKV